MSALKQLPRRRRIHFTFVMLFAVVALALGFLQSRAQQGSLIFLYLLIAFVILGVIMAVAGRPLRCPDCGKFLREHGDHPKSQETYLYICRHCDVIWDTLIPRSSD